jgi:tripartite-type tricarboxylate transporter receptor subunit TctC
VRIIVPYAPGGSNDIIARMLAPKLSERIGQPVIVENRAGAGSNIGSEAVARSNPDGTTLLLGSPANAVNVSLYSKMTFDPRKDLARVMLIGTSPNVLVVHPSVQATTLAEFIALGKSTPNGITYASSGSGGAMHLSGELFKMLTGANLVHVPYRGAGPAVADLVGGQVQAMFDNMITALPNIKSGRVRPLGITSKARHPSLASVPTIEEAGVAGYESYVWWGVFAAGGTPADTISRLQRDLSASLKSPDVLERLQSQGIEPVGSTPAEFERFFNAEVEKWGKVVRQAGVKVE